MDLLIDWCIYEWFALVSHPLFVNGLVLCSGPEALHATNDNKLVQTWAESWHSPSLSPPINQT